MPGSYHQRSIPRRRHQRRQLRSWRVRHHGRAARQILRWRRPCGGEVGPPQPARFHAARASSRSAARSAIRSLPIAQAWPDAEMTVVDLGAPVLRYGLARAKSLGRREYSLRAGQRARICRAFRTQSFDWIQTTMFLHELSTRSLANILRETRRLLRPGGIVLHVEQPQYTPDMPLFEQAMRDWDAYYNNEPFWSRMHELDLDQAMVDAGFARDKLIHGGVTGGGRQGSLPRRRRRRDRGLWSQGRVARDRRDRLMSIADAIAEAGAKPAGKRPYFLRQRDGDRPRDHHGHCPGTGGARQRVDTLERLLEGKGVLTPRARSIASSPDPAAAVERALANQEYIARILRIVQQRNEANEIDERHRVGGGRGARSARPHERLRTYRAGAGRRVPAPAARWRRWRQRMRARRRW